MRKSFDSRSKKADESPVVENLFKDELENTIKSNEGIISQLHMTKKQDSVEMAKLR